MATYTKQDIANLKDRIRAELPSLVLANPERICFSYQTPSVPVCTAAMDDGCCVARLQSQSKEKSMAQAPWIPSSPSLPCRDLPFDA